MLQRHWNGNDLTPLWQVRHADTAQNGLALDLMDDPAALARICGPVEVVLGLAGVVPGRGELSLNAPLGRAAVSIGAATDAKRVFIASSAAVYGPSDQPLREEAPLRPTNAYGAAKHQMEIDVREHVTDLRTGLTILRIGNVAGADALLSQPGTTRRLDRFTDGQGPRRSYIGPKALADVLSQLVLGAANGQDLPEILNLALPGAVGMDALCRAAGIQVTWTRAPATALPLVALDVAKLEALLPLPRADAHEIIADWQADRALC